LALGQKDKCTFPGDYSKEIWSTVGWLKERSLTRSTRLLKRGILRVHLKMKSSGRLRKRNGGVPNRERITVQTRTGQGMFFTEEGRGGKKAVSRKGLKNGLEPGSMKEKTCYRKKDASAARRAKASDTM